MKYEFKISKEQERLIKEKSDRLAYDLIYDDENISFNKEILKLTIKLIFYYTYGIIFIIAAKLYLIMLENPSVCMLFVALFAPLLIGWFISKIIHILGK